MTSPYDPAPHAPRSPWFTERPPAPQPAAPLVPARPAGDGGAPIYEQLVAEFGDPFSLIGPIHSRYPRRRLSGPAGN
ncbi:hypothetical protein ACFU7Y_09110 [Kitasatospora sp. NPDC057542]|uniref:hypothetical protein n=1 Tax=Streptomycetaceae TaxID=2062 RepID=UPI001CCE4C33|nr:hypothetical protein [Streptomyces sp. LS1784]